MPEYNILIQFIILQEGETRYQAILLPAEAICLLILKKGPLVQASFSEIIRIRHSEEKLLEIPDVFSTFLKL
jgi:hypothetical protein